MKIRSYEGMKNSYKNYLDYCDKLEIDPISECPICHFRISPNFIGEIEVECNFICVLIQCPNCDELITIKYSMKWAERPTHTGYEYLFKEINPKRAKEISVTDKVKEISPMFIEIYRQASAAEANNLNQIVGIGYRKSLEFLIKDYLKHKLPDKKEEIEDKFLGKCIDMIENANIKRMAKGATWIGNDETHYIRKWENKDILDLKKLIDLTLTWIDLELKTEEYSVDMNL